MKTSPSKTESSTFTLLIWAVVCCAIGGAWLLFNSQATLQITLILSGVYFTVCIVLSLFSSRRDLSFLTGFFRLGQLLFLYMGLQCAGHVFGWPGAEESDPRLTLLFGTSPLIFATLGTALWAALLTFGRNSSVGGIALAFLLTFTVILWTAGYAPHTFDSPQDWVLHNLITEGLSLLVPLALLFLSTLTPFKKTRGGRAAMTACLGLIMFLGSDLIELGWSLATDQAPYGYPPAHVQWLMLGLCMAALLLSLQLHLSMGALLSLGFICWQAGSLTQTLNLPTVALVLQLSIVALGVICLFAALIREYRRKTPSPDVSTPASVQTPPARTDTLFDRLNRRYDEKAH